MQTILNVERDRKVVSGLRLALENAGFGVHWMPDLRSGLKAVSKIRPNLVITAIEEPTVGKNNPVMLIRQVAYVPLIIIGADEEAAMMLEIGADACLSRPPDVTEVVARVKALLRRHSNSGSSQSGSSMAMEDAKPSLPGEEQKFLSETEFRLASCMAKNRGKLHDYSRLLAEVWSGKNVSRDTLHYYIRQLRAKAYHIVGVRGVGYYVPEC